jgi:hypothetical protein
MGTFFNYEKLKKGLTGAVTVAAQGISKGFEVAKDLAEDLTSFKALKDYKLAGEVQLSYIFYCLLLYCLSASSMCLAFVNTQAQAIRQHSTCCPTDLGTDLVPGSACLAIFYTCTHHTPSTFLTQDTSCSCLQAMSHLLVLGASGRSLVLSTKSQVGPRSVLYIWPAHIPGDWVPHIHHCVNKHHPLRGSAAVSGNASHADHVQRIHSTAPCAACCNMQCASASSRGYAFSSSESKCMCHMGLCVPCVTTKVSWGHPVSAVNSGTRGGCTSSGSIEYADIFLVLLLLLLLQGLCFQRRLYGSLTRSLSQIRPAGMVSFPTSSTLLQCMHLVQLYGASYAVCTLRDVLDFKDAHRPCSSQLTFHAVLCCAVPAVPQGWACARL